MAYLCERHAGIPWPVKIRLRDSGVCLYGPTVIVMVSMAGLPVESVMIAVMICVPSISRLVDRLAPVAESPGSKLDVQTIKELMSPSSVSLAVPAKLTVAPEAKVAPSMGLVIDTVGVVFDTVTMTVSVATLPSASVMVAVMV